MLSRLTIGLGVVCLAALSGKVNGQIEPLSGPVAYREYYEPAQIPRADDPAPRSPSDAPLSPSDAPLLQADQYLEGRSPYAMEPSCGCGAVHQLECEPNTYRMFGSGYAGIHARGWLNLGYTANDRSPPSRYNGPQGLNDRDEFLGNQTYLILEKPVERCDCSWSFGGRADVLFGTDYVVTEQVGWEQTQTGAPKWNNRRLYGISTPQVYLEAAKGDFSIKVGRFYSLVGYESVMAPENFFYSHSYTFTNGSPFTHSGAVATWGWSDTLSFSAGAVNGWDRFDGIDDRIGFLGGFQYRPRHGAYSLAGTIVSDHEVAVLRGNRDARTMYSMVFNYNHSERTQLVLEFDGGRHKEGGPVAGLDAEWYGLTQYAYYTINDCWKLGARFEWFRDDDGVRVSGFRADNPAPGNLVGNFYEVSLGANWSPSDNLMFRPEIRWDWFDGTGSPYDDGAQTEQLTFGLDAIIHF